MVIPRADRHYGGVPCENLSLLLAGGQKKWKTCIEDATGVTGKGYKAEREFCRTQEVHLAVEEQAVCVSV